MNERTFSYVTGRFRDYYRETELQLPPDIDTREWGFIPFSQDGDTRMIRHKSLLELGDPESFLEQQHPQHVYTSASKYDTPGAPTMEEKGWTASDLVFDIDVDEDHIPAELSDQTPLTYAEMLDVAKRHLQRLVAILDADFGFDDISIVFSGGRGYHVHVRDAHVQSLSSQERAEMVSYIRGVNLDSEALTRTGQTPIGKSLPTDHRGFARTGGWSERTHARLVSLMEELQTCSQATAEAKLTAFDGIGDKMATTVYQSLTDDAARIRAGEVTVGPGMTQIVTALIERTRAETYAAIDEPVTTDINRLIRLPGTLHGGHALTVTPVSRDGLDAFDPLVDAVPPTFTRQSISITPTTDQTVRLLGETHTFDAGEQTTVPEAVGIHMMVEGWAEKDRE